MPSWASKMLQQPSAQRFIRPDPIPYQGGWVGVYQSQAIPNLADVAFRLVIWEGDPSGPPARLPTNQVIRTYHFANDALDALELLKQGASIEYVQAFRHGPYAKPKSRVSSTVDTPRRQKIANKLLRHLEPQVIGD